MTLWTPNEERPRSWRDWTLSPAEFVGLAFVVAISYYLVFVAQ